MIALLVPAVALWVAASAPALAAPAPSKVAPLGAVVAANGMNLNASETRLLEMLKEIVAKLSVTGAARVEPVVGTTATEFRVFYLPEDEIAVRGLGGVTQGSILTLFNELSIADQRAEAAATHRPFDLNRRRLLFIRFYKQHE